MPLNQHKGHYLPRFFCLCLFPFLSHVLVRLFSCLLPGLQSRPKQEISVSVKMSISTLGPNQRPLQGLFTGLKRPGWEVDLLPPSSVSVDSGWGYCSFLSMFLNDVHSDDFLYLQCLFLVLVDWLFPTLWGHEQLKRMLLARFRGNGCTELNPSSQSCKKKTWKKIYTSGR